jgi:hypothetical protein
MNRFSVKKSQRSGEASTKRGIENGAPFRQVGHFTVGSGDWKVASNQQAGKPALRGKRQVKHMFEIRFWRISSV